MNKCSGAILKKYSFVQLCANPYAARSMLQLCKDNKKYAFLRPEYISPSELLPILLRVGMRISRKVLCRGTLSRGASHSCKSFSAFNILLEEETT
jgi:hypothetical protein